MIDIHAHVLYSVDDGPATMEESIFMLRMAAAEGIKHVIATPHFMPGKYENQLYEEKLNRLIEAVREEKLEIEVSLGSEVYLHEGIKQSLETGRCLTLAKSTLVLLELPYLKFYPVFEHWLYEMRLSGYRPILAHVERYDYFMENPALLRRLIDSGCYGQMNAEMLIEGKTRRLAFKLIQQGLVHVIATDCHNIHDRKPMLTKAYDLVQKKLGDNSAADLFLNNANALLGNQAITNKIVDSRKMKSWAERFQTKKGYIEG